MIDLSLSEEQKMLRDLAADFAKNEIAPFAAYHDETGEFPYKILQKAWETGLMNTHIPQEFGGPGLGTFENCLIAEEIAAACTGIMTAMEANSLAQAPIIVAGSDDQKKEFLEPLTEMLKFCAYGVTEPAAGSDVGGIETKAVKKGNNYILNGNKMWITNAGVADWFYVLAKTDAAAGNKGMSAFVVPAKSAGITVGKKENNLGQRASDTRAITFEDVAVPEKNRLGKEGDGFKITMAAFDHTRPPVAAGAVGLAKCAMEHAIRYAKERTTFGKKIAEHQSIAFMIADMAKNIEAARLLVWKSAWEIDNAQRNTVTASMAKCFAADMAMETALNAVQIFGGYGYNKEYPVEKLMRDAKIYQIYEGTSQIQRLIISRAVLG